MEFAYQPEAWHSLFEMLAIASVTLTGMLFIGLSINLRVILSDPARLALAREALVTLLVLPVISLFVLIPDQGRLALGIELIVLSAAVLVVSLRLQLRTLQRLPARRRRSWKARLIGLNSATLAIAIAGVGLVTGQLGGLLWLVPTALLCLVWSSCNCWSLAVQVADASS